MIDIFETNFCDRLSMLEDCASYLDGTIYNLEAKVTNFDDNQSVI